MKRVVWMGCCTLGIATMVSAQHTKQPGALEPLAVVRTEVRPAEKKVVAPASNSFRQTSPVRPAPIQRKRHHKTVSVPLSNK